MEPGTPTLTRICQALGVSSATTTWGEGEYELMARCLAPASEALVDALNVHAEDSVIDLACGTGNVAVLAAQRGASVLGVDFEPRLIDLARDRIDSERARWLCADVAGLDLGGERFLVVVSAFGVMYVPDHREAALTLRRCGVRGARVGLAAWMPGGFMERMGAVLAPYLPAPLSSSVRRQRGAIPRQWSRSWRRQVSRSARAPGLRLSCASLT